MKFAVDRNLPLPLRNQLQGLIEYGISCGELAPGEMLPSVRELAETLGVAPMTVSQVYAELKEAGLLQTKPGAGTFVSQRPAPFASDPVSLTHLYKQADELIDQSRKLGMALSDLVAVINARAGRGDVIRPRQRIAMVGLFEQATESYGRFIADRLGGEVDVDPITISSLESDPQAVANAIGADLVVTIVNRLQQVTALLPGAKVVAIRFTPSQETRRALASLDSLARVAVVSLFPEFLPIMKSGVERFAPHVSDIVAGIVDVPSFDASFAQANVIIYATGAEQVLSHVPPHIPVIEYRHTPDVADIERTILPALKA